MKIISTLIILLYFTITLSAYESQIRLKTVIIGKVAKYIEWSDKNSNKFIITVLNNQYGTAFNEVYKGKKIKSKSVIIKYIKNIAQLTSSDVLYIPKANNEEIESILDIVKDRNILTISDLRGFAQKSGCIQIYFIGRKMKLKMNIESMYEKGFIVNKTLIRVVDIVKGDEL